MSNKRSHRIKMLEAEVIKFKAEAVLWQARKQRGEKHILQYRLALTRACHVFSLIKKRGLDRSTLSEVDVALDTAEKSLAGWPFEGLPSCTLPPKKQKSSNFFAKIRSFFLEKARA